ncbi:SH3 domain-containing kinase-binding protein 1 isoform X1 [Pangasianodon hypophthalmus]|uniref:SH3 domain-containing kinase-binding protein 1 isoform X1 n=1 Tax=Pangasianodon hypophthalmus TaxID=310915 RepID=UPI001479890C|nr:SH3 domain-containing kinase-binding protein 1 isoform X1 [Pangasianodon hypophthalmus]
MVKSKSKVEAVVEFDYQAQHDDELTIAIGDIISNIRKDEGGWWEGEVDGRRGLFPDNFVREIKKEVKKELSSASQVAKSDLSNGSASPGSESSLRPAKKGEAIRKRRCKAAFSYIPQNEDELELKIGDVIEVLGEVEEGWWEGCLNGKTGMFPSNFTVQLPADTEDLTSPPEDTRSTRTSVKDSTGSESDGGDSSSIRSDAGSVASSSEIQPKKVRGFGFGDIFKDQPIKLRPRSMDLDSELEKLTVKKAAPSVPQETMKTEPENKAKVKELCKVLFPYDAQNEDELSIKEGDIVTIVSKECADAGWWLGELNGKQGVFPDNFVKLFVPEVEKERPKKPPPPAAPTTKPITDKKPEVKKVPPERPESLPQRAEEKGDEIKLVEFQKPVLPIFPPKKPLPPKSNNSLTRPPKRPERPERPERPAAPSAQCDSSGVASDRTSSDKSAEIDIDDFDSIVSSTEKLSHPTASRPRVTDRRPRSQIFTSSSLSSSDLLDSLSPEDEQREREKGKDEPDSFPPRSLDNTRKMPKALPIITAPEKSSKPSSLTTTPGAAALRPHSPSIEAKMKSEQGSTVLEELRAQLRELRATVELMKSQHKQEMKQLVSELDEEKKIRLSLQMDVENIKKVLSK